MARPLMITVGATTAAVLLYFTPQFEGMVLRGYKDPIGVVTACAGHTATAVLGRAYTKAECSQLLQQDLEEHAEGVLRCTPGLKGRIPQLAAAVSFTFNVGITKYCGSTMAKKFAAQDYKGACAELPKWVYAGGEALPGLVKRRAAEYALCVDGL